jgi:hypothetical protein
LKRLATIAILLICTTLSAQIEVTNKGLVNNLMRQINSLYFEKTEDNSDIAYVGGTAKIQIVWFREIGVDSVTYTQFLIMTKYGMAAEGHTIVTDSYGKNAYGYHEMTLKYK